MHRYVLFIFIYRCEPGFTGDSCQPRRRINETMQADFGIRYEPDSDFVNIWGGEVIGGDKGCGTLVSGETLYFSDVSTLSIKLLSVHTCWLLHVHVMLNNHCLNSRHIKSYLHVKPCIVKM